MKFLLVVGMLVMVFSLSLGLTTLTTRENAYRDLPILSTTKFVEVCT